MKYICQIYFIYTFFLEVQTRYTSNVLFFWEVHIKYTWGILKVYWISTRVLTSSFTAFHWFNLIEFSKFLQILLFLQLHVNVHLSHIWYRLNIHRPFPHYFPVSKDKEMRTRLGRTISYKSLYFVHLSLELAGAFVYRNAGQVYRTGTYKTGAIYLNQLDHFNTTQLQWTIWNILQGNWLPVFFVVLIPLKNKKPNK